MTRNVKSTALFYSRDSGGKHENTPEQYVAWARRKTKELGLSFSADPDEINEMIRDGRSVSGDLYFDFDVSGNKLSRAGLDALIKRATTDEQVSHVLIPRRDRLARPNNPIDGTGIEMILRGSGNTLVFMDKTLPPLEKGKRHDIGELLTSVLDYNYAGEFRRELAQKMVMAQINVAKAGFSTGGRPPYGFRRWLATADGTPVRQLIEGERVRMAGHHVVWRPGPDEELAVIRRILDMLRTMPANRVAATLTGEGVPTPDSGRFRTDNGVRHATSGVWHQTTIVNIARNSLLVAVATYGRRSMGDQMRFTNDGPRELTDADYRSGDTPKVVQNPADQRIVADTKFDPVVDREEQKELIAILDRRAGTQKGQPRSRDPNRNPLGGRVYDMNCSWLMYREPYQESFRYKCGLYSQSHGAKCAHNHINGPLATKFLLSCIQQRLLSPRLLARLEEKVRGLAVADESSVAAERDLESQRRALKKLDSEISQVSNNLARAQTTEQYDAVARVFEGLKEEQARRTAELQDAESHARVPNEIESEIERTMEIASRLTDLASGEESLKSAIELFDLTNAKLFLQFEPVKVKKRTINKLRGGVVTFGNADPPISLYDGPTGRGKIKSSNNPGQGNDVSGPESVVSGSEEESLGNVSRGDWI